MKRRSQSPSRKKKGATNRKSGALSAGAPARRGRRLEIDHNLNAVITLERSKVRQVMILDGKINRLVLTHKDRLLRFGEEKLVEVVIINQGDESSFEEAVDAAGA